MFAVGAAVLATAWVGLTYSDDVGRIAAIWIADAILLSAILHAGPRRWAVLLVIGFVANFIASIATDHGAVLGACLAACHTLEVVVCAVLVGGLARRVDLRQPKQLFLFCLVAVGPASLLPALGAAGVYHALNGGDFLQIFGSWYASNALGLVTITPLLMMVGIKDIEELVHPTLLLRVAGVVAVMLVTLSVVFLQASLPLLFLVFPAVLFASLSLGFTGAALAVLLTAAFALWATIAGLGPLALIDASFRVQIYVLQLFIATVAIKGVAVASLLGERDLLSAALAQSPDFHFVKNTKSQFISVNQNVADLAGFEKPAALIGDTDFDIASPERARELLEEEREIIFRGGVLKNREEKVTDPDGTMRWFETSKVRLSSRTGRVVGLAGVTRDVTERKMLQADLDRSRRELHLILSEMSDGIALIGPDLRIEFCNEKYQSLFPLTRDMRVPGAHLPAILYRSAELGEQINIPTGAIKEWVTEVVAGLKTGGEQEVQLRDGTWLHIRTHVIAGRFATTLLSDITKIKSAELDLLAVTEQLRVLASTDGLTGLTNRRTFDERLDQEIARCRRSRTPISLILFDIDHFKKYNDRYGHPAGDECLQRVAAALKDGAKRPGDVVARYGGEEFCLILPETDEGGAFFLAEQLRLTIRDLALTHEASEKKIVTISVGVASMAHDGNAKSAQDLISRADEALYRAKSTGRDRVTGWSATVSNAVA